ncbi:hypothetical protein SAMN05444000_12747 [Shimia gijangensis]|uniref:Uncharacterized protein n=1 Tax=Shimia gijangensis TaxID=1470563 RepID=A0A1M6S3W1_9RHOB|nr:hypothetical protein [Shimia gijangensis]SHK39524.1 hypothetical protein SAMN05444000_12747 [Shimia gijangensis]
MTEKAERLFEVLKRELQSVCPDAVVIPEERSISYHDPDFFLEVIPRKYGLGILIDLEFARSAEISEHLEDASQWTFIMYAAFSGGTYCKVEKEQEIMSILPAVRLAHARGAAG